MAHALLNQKRMSLWAASVLVKISFKQDVGSFVNIEARDAWKLNALSLLQIEAGWAPYKILNT